MPPVPVDPSVNRHQATMFRAIYHTRLSSRYIIDCYELLSNVAFCVSLCHQYYSCFVHSYARLTRNAYAIVRARDLSKRCIAEDGGADYGRVELDDCVGGGWKGDPQRSALIVRSIVWCSSIVILVLLTLRLVKWW